MGVSGQGDQSLPPKTQENDDDNAVRSIINKRRDQRPCGCLTCALSSSKFLISSESPQKSSSQ